MAKKPVRKPPVEDTAVQSLWESYFRRQKSQDTRDRIVEHYLAWATKTAGMLARSLGLRDRENAIGEALLHFSTVVVPRYDGRGQFQCWAIECMKRRLIDLRRKQRESMASIDAPRGVEGELSLAEILPGRPEVEASEFRFGEFVATLDDQSACLLWLRYFRDAPLKEAAETLGMTPKEAAKTAKKAIRQLRKLYRVA